jgi:hypothetical protein
MCRLPKTPAHFAYNSGQYNHAVAGGANFKALTGQRTPKRKDRQECLSYLSNPVSNTTR